MINDYDLQPLGNFERVCLKKVKEMMSVNTVDLLKIQHEDVLLSIDAREALRKGYHPRQDILALIQEAPSGTICEIHVPHHTGPLIAALEALGMNVAIAEVEHGHWRLRVLKM